MVGFSSSGDFKNILSFIKRILNDDEFSDLDLYGRIGVEALARATPVHTGITAESWGYRILHEGRGVTIEWFNDSVDDAGTPIVILLQYGHGTGTGGYVAGRDFINPAIQPVFDQIADDVWKKVIS